MIAEYAARLARSPVMRCVLVIALLAGSAHADTTTTQTIGREQGGTLVVERRELIPKDGYAFIQLVAVWTRDGSAPVRTEILAESAKCAEVRGAPGGLEVEVCQEEAGDLVAITPWRLDPARGAFTAGAPYEHSDYVDAATMIVRDLRAHRYAAARAGLAALGMAPDANLDPIDWWWQAQWLAAEWPLKGTPLRQRISSLLTQPGAVYHLIQHDDLTTVPGIELAGAHVTPAKLPTPGALLDRAERVLRAGSLDDIAVADELANALDLARNPGSCH